MKKAESLLKLIPDELLEQLSAETLVDYQGKKFFPPRQVFLPSTNKAKPSAAAVSPTCCPRTAR